MKIENVIVIPANTAVTTSFTSDALLIEHIAMLALQFTYTGATSCVIKVQGSCDAGVPSGQSRTTAAAAVTNWSDIPNAATSSLTGAGPATVALSLVDVPYNWIRVVVTGAITITSGRMNAKGV